MRIGLYGLPSAGKTHILNQICFMSHPSGSSLLRELNPEFECLDDYEKNKVRKTLANNLIQYDNLIMDGHYSFNGKVVFTEEDGLLYDVFLYLYIDPEILEHRMAQSDKNRKYKDTNIQEWQQFEIECLREYCHRHDKDFYVLDNPPTNEYKDVSLVVAFIQAINNGFSCVNYARFCAQDIEKQCPGKFATLLDGDKTLVIDDTSKKVFGYSTNLFDNNFYTGFQSWRQWLEFDTYQIAQVSTVPSEFRETLLTLVDNSAAILTSGHYIVWDFIARHLGIPCYCGSQMSAETKYFIVKFLQNSGKIVSAYGDSMNDYYMLKQANTGYLLAKYDGTISRSLRGKNLEGITIVRTGTD